MAEQTLLHLRRGDDGRWLPVWPETETDYGSIFSPEPPIKYMDVRQVYPFEVQRRIDTMDRTWTG